MIQLCKEIGLIDGRAVPLQNNSAVQQTHSGSQPPDNNLLELTKSVTELQKTVCDLTESVSQLKRNEQGSVYPSQGNFSTMDQVQTNNTSQTRMAGALEGIGFMTVPGSSQTSMDSCPQGTAVTSPDSGTSQGSAVLANTIHSTESTGYVKTRYGYAAESLPFVETVYPFASRFSKVRMLILQPYLFLFILVLTLTLE